MSNYAYNEILEQIQLLTDDEKLQLLADVATMLRHQVKARPKHNIMEFEGFAKEIWEGVDVEKYINEERNSWDG